MKISMQLNDEFFNKMKLGLKTVEMRLFDEKRQALKVGDVIEFTNRKTGEILIAQITNLEKFKNFEELYNCKNKTELGYNESDTASFKDMEQFYSIDEQQKFGVIAITIKVI